MRFSRLHIENFRSVGSSGVDITFPSGNAQLAFIGVNGAGKSNILQALGVVLGAFPFNRFAPTETDFFAKRTENDIIIDLHIDPPLVERDVYQKEFQVAAFRYRAWVKKRGDGRGVITTEHVCLDEEDAPLVKQSRIYRKNTASVAYDNQARPVAPADHLWKLGSVFYVDAKRLDTFFDKTTGYTPLGRLFDTYRDEFRNPSNLMTFRGKQVSRLDALDTVGDDLESVLRTPKLAAIEQALTERMGRFMGVPTRALKMSMALPSHSELFDEVVRLNVIPREGIPPLPVDQLGSGHRAILRLAVIDTLLSESNGEHYTLLVEEPEIYLHVHLRRYFAKMLQKLGSAGHQVITATHSPRFVSLGRPSELVRCSKTAAGETQVRQIVGQPLGKKVPAKVASAGNEEMLFASHVIITEGQDDQAVMRLLFDKAGVDLDARSISVIATQSADNFPDYLALAGELGIDFYAIHDEDDPIAKQIRNVSIRNQAQKYATSGSSANLYVFKPRLEAVMGYTDKVGMDVLLAALDPLSFDQICDKHPVLVQPVLEFIKTRNLAGGGA